MKRLFRHHPRARKILPARDAKALTTAAEPPPRDLRTGLELPRLV
jgi:hypothetical protein